MKKFADSNPEEHLVYGLEPKMSFAPIYQKRDSIGRRK